MVTRFSFCRGKNTYDNVRWLLSNYWRNISRNDITHIINITGDIEMKEIMSQYLQYPNGIVGYESL